MIHSKADCSLHPRWRENSPNNSKNGTQKRCADNLHPDVKEKLKHPILIVSRMVDCEKGPKSPAGRNHEHHRKEYGEASLLNGAIEYAHGHAAEAAQTLE